MKTLSKDELMNVNGGGEKVGDDLADWLTITGGVGGLMLAIASLAASNETHDYGSHKLDPNKMYE